MSKMLIVFIFAFSTSSLFSESREPKSSDKVRAAVDSCFSENQIVRPEKGVHLEEKERQIIQSCMKSKGFDDFKGPRKR